MTEHAPEFYTDMLSRLDTIHNDLIEIQPKKDINVISKPLPMNGASVLIGFPGSGLVGTIALQYMVDRNHDFEVFPPAGDDEQRRYQ
jgi:uncharacterized protein